MKKISPCLWFDDQAEEATKLYTSLFPNSKIENISYYGDEGPKPKGTALVITFRLNGQEFMALNGGPEFKFTPALSLFVNCENQDEVDYLWENLSKGGEKGQCGWLTDKFGISWQIVPILLGKLMSDKNPRKSVSVMHAMLQMKKLDMAELQKAYDQA
jgi:predicted 3-demethylubiquinone-9 3-methyltransferase (glyoxalase superfamily)